jgi:hypothetical protein
MKMKKLTLSQKIFISIIAATIVGFCIITNSAGVYRSYWAEDLPLVIQMNVDTPTEYDPVVQQAIDMWNEVEGSYFAFDLGARTNANGPQTDGINLLYFDSNYDNFTQGSNTIAFSRTITSNVGGYHAVESDYIYNAAGYPPATNGSPNQMDLLTITLHEIGHHLGLMHHGDAGNANGGGSAGCGHNLPSQVMFWSVGFGTQKHQLFLHDEMGTVAIYPNFLLLGSIVDADTDEPIENAKLVFNEGTYAAQVGDVENAAGRDMRPGEVFTEAPTLSDGTFLFAINTEAFSFHVEKFGYEPSEVTNVDFNTPVGFGDTQQFEADFQLTKTARVNLAGTITNAKTNQPIQPEVKVTWVGDENETQSAVAASDGTFSFEVPSNAYYTVEFFFDPPFEPYYVMDSLLVGSTNSTLDVNIDPANLLFIYDVANSVYSFDYRNVLQKFGYGHVEWSIDEKGGAPSAELLDEFSDPLTIFWVSGGDTTSNLNEEDVTLLENHLAKGQRLIMTGRNIVEFTDSTSSLFTEYAGVVHVGNSSALRARGFEGDIIGDGISSLMVGAGKDLLQLSDARKCTVDRVFYYGTSDADSNNIAAVRSQNEAEGWKFILFGDGLDKISAAARDTLLARSLKYAGNSDFITGVEIDVRNDELPNVYSISQNYPNPFNPSTTISFSLPVNANVSLKIFNILGEQVAVLKDGFMNAGSYELRWDAVSASLSSGIYFYNINAEGMNGTHFNQTKKMILLK